MMTNKRTKKEISKRFVKELVGVTDKLYKFKKLKWKKRDCKLVQIDGEEQYVAKTAFGDYTIRGWVSRSKYYLDCPGGGHAPCDSLKIAKMLVRQDVENKLKKHLVEVKNDD